jgi:E3 ubiquitin-protein ligase UBR7
MGLPANMEPIRKEEGDTHVEERKESQVTNDSQTAVEYDQQFYDAVEVDVLRMFRSFINEQLELEADAREVLPYKFDTCTKPIGSLRQNVFACLTCNPAPASPAQVYTPAGLCYSCSISCHSDHNLVELFSRRNFTCDCGTKRMETSICALRFNETTGEKGARMEGAATTNEYNQNFQNRFCGCSEEYDAHLQKGTMFQCMGLGSVETGGCGEDWWHPECLMGLPRDWQLHVVKPEIAEVKSDGEAKNAEAEANEEEEGQQEDHPVPEGFPGEEEFEHMICYRCVESNSWIKQYAGSPGFLAPVFKKQSSSSETVPEKAPIEASLEKPSLKRKASNEDDIERPASPIKRTKAEDLPASGVAPPKTDSARPVHKHERLPPPPTGTFSIFLKEDFRDHFCHCPKCYRNLVPHPQLLEEEDTYEPPLSESDESEVPGSGARSQGTGSLLERGEAALSGVDRVRAIEGVMVYNQLKDKVKAFLKPYAESGTPVGAEDIKAYFEKLRGDDQAIKEAGRKAGGKGDEKNGEKGGNQKEQSGY